MKIFSIFQQKRNIYLLMIEWKMNYVLKIYPATLQP